MPLDLIRRMHHGCGPYGFVRVLRFLFGFVNVGGLRQVGRTVFLADESAHFLDGFSRYARRIRTHIGDQTYRAFLAQLDTFIEPLREHHGALHAEPELARRFLLQGRGDERRHRITPLLAGTDRLDYILSTFEGLTDLISRCLVADLRSL